MRVIFWYNENMQLPFEVQLIKIVTIDIVYSIVRWPVWWYTQGFWGQLTWVASGMKREWWNLALTAWLKSILTPMYGDYSFAGRAISFVARMVILIYRMVMFIIWGAWYVIMLIPYLLLPALPAYLFVKFFRTS